MNATYRGAILLLLVMPFAVAAAPLPGSSSDVTRTIHDQTSRQEGGGAVGQPDEPIKLPEQWQVYPAEPPVAGVDVKLRSIAVKGASYVITNEVLSRLFVDEIFCEAESGDEKQACRAQARERFDIEPGQCPDKEREECRTLRIKREGMQVPLQRYLNFVGAITQEYRKGDYFLSRAIVPKQNVDRKAAVLTVTLIEGHIANVTTRDNKKEPAEAKAEAELKLLMVTGAGMTCPEEGKLGDAEGKASTCPLTQKRLERSLLLAEDIPGVTVSAVMRPSASEGAADLDIVKTEFDPWSFHVTADNYGSRYIGPTTWAFSAKYNNDSGGELGVEFAAAAPGKELQLGRFDYSHPIEDDGLRWIVGAGASRSQPGYTLSLLDTLNTITEASAGLSYPLVLNRNYRLSLEGGAKAQNVTTDVIGAPFVRDHIRQGYATVTYSSRARLTGACDIEATGEGDVGTG